MSRPTTKPTISKDPNEKTPEGASSQTFGLNNDNYSTILDTLKDHALKLVANATSEMSPEQWGEWVNEHTAVYADNLVAYIADQQRQLLDRVEAELPTERVKVPYGLMELQKAFENGHDKAIGQVQAVIKDIREGLGRG